MLSQYTLSNNVLKSLIVNARDSMFGVMRIILNQLIVLIQNEFTKESNKAATIFYTLLGVYILCVLCQSLLGYFLLKTANREETLFLSIPSDDCRELQKKCTRFIANSRVPSTSGHLTCRTNNSTSPPRAATPTTPRPTTPSCSNSLPRPLPPRSIMSTKNVRRPAHDTASSPGAPARDYNSCGSSCWPSCCRSHT